MAGTFFADVPLTAGATAALGEAAAHHARVRRLVQNDSVRVTNGAGIIAVGQIATITRDMLAVSVERVDAVPRPVPIHLRVAIADRERMLWLAEKATELGIASWQAVRFRRSASVSPRGEGTAFAEKTRARMVSALEQSGGAWMPALLPDTSLDALAAGSCDHGIVLDVSGVPLARLAAETNATESTLLVGPEGGIEADELAALIGAGWRPACLAATTLRFETAGVAAVAVLRAMHTRDSTV